jgi:sterol 24-C-methyltransferase
MPPGGAVWYDWVMTNSKRVIKYYHTLESKLGYRWLQGIKHFGYYPEGQENLPKRDAQWLMNDQIAKSFDLPTGARVLDAGCGEGGVAVYLHHKYGYDVHGIDLLDFNIARAKRTAGDKGIDPANFQVGDYMHLPFDDNTFDGVYTMETLVHAPDYKQALAEFHRILKPGGKLALFEYSLTSDTEVKPEEKVAMDRIRYVNDIAAMPAFNEFITGTFAQKLADAGFKDVAEQDITARMWPMLELFYNKARIAYPAIKKLRLQKHFINTMSAIEFYEHPDLWRYNKVSATNS